jgi:pimeloyl-ACP methyl ester carboxylesterase
MARKQRFPKATLCGATVGALTLLAACGAVTDSGSGPRAEPQAGAVPCFVEDMSSRAKCYRIKVPEDWAAPSGRQLVLNVAVLPATGVTKDQSALFVLAGGPGQAATHYGALLTKELDRVRATRPVILMDQRGTGASNGLRCIDERPFGTAVTTESEIFRKCREGWSKTALQHYTTPDVVRDIDSVRQALGFDSLDLWGASWGTRTALLYMRSFPGRVRTAVLDGVTGPNQSLFAKEARYAQQSLDSLFSACESDRPCRNAFPDLRQRASGWLRGDAPKNVQYVAADGRIASGPLDPSLLRQIVRGALYSPDSAARLPFALDRLTRGDATALVAIANGAASLNRETMFHGATFSSLCAEEIPRIGKADVERASAGTFVGSGYYSLWAGVCEGWPVKPLPRGYAEPVTSDVPVLLLSGALDPVTPPGSAESVKAHLPRAWHIVAPYAGHNVTSVPCAGRVIAEFIRRGDGSRLDASCITKRKRPPFMVSPLGPAA